MSRESIYRHNEKLAQDAHDRDLNAQAGENASSMIATIKSSIQDNWMIIVGINVVCAVMLLRSSKGWAAAAILLGPLALMGKWLMG